MSMDAVEFTRELIRIDTINPPGNETVCTNVIAAFLQNAGFDTSLHNLGTGRANLVARAGGDPDLPALCLTGHVDTVPLGHKVWTVDPFAADISDGKLFGRGSSDMKSGVAAFCVAAASLADRLDGTPGVELVMTVGEETGCEGAYSLAANAGALGRCGAVVVAEPTSNRAWVGHKGALWLQASSEGVTAHGSMPERGDNAIYKAARAVTKLEDFDFNIARHEVLGGPTLNVGTIQGGINVNSVPDHAVFGIDFRTIPGQDHARLKEQIASYLGDEVELQTIVDVPGVWTDPEVEWIQDVFAIVARVTGKQPAVETASYFTDASVMKPAYGNPPTVVLGPGESSMAHQTDEYCFVDKITEAVPLYEEIIRNWCNI